ncbi:MAG: 30S ribosomal protein S7 [Patescibacteria group bacterium]|uniref:Small ribosomal subunit protein uS7 n=1 Tax=candidate division WWE3 bacterium TaxID=2053526 RepID=A0A955J1V9_UNCKA|nr:30S ribosomal protein S7 [candidate division WWE3 bacterium]
MRAKRAKKRVINPDPIYKSRVMTRFINVVMLDGKKATAEKLVHTAVAKLSEDKKEAVEIFEAAIRNVMPKQEVRSRRVGGATYQVPMPVKHERAEALALRWIVSSARNKAGKSMDKCLYEELRDANDGIGASIKKRDETHKMADSNKAFAHFRI